MTVLSPACYSGGGKAAVREKPADSFWVYSLATGPSQSASTQTRALGDGTSKHIFLRKHSAHQNQNMKDYRMNYTRDPITTPSSVKCTLLLHNPAP